jgi:isoleucyl-tRNA synthetase
VIEHELRSGEQPVVPGAYAVRVVEKEKEGKKVKVAVAECPPMSADLMRWLYCRQNPSSNINFGPGPAEELRSKFTLKLWNTYAFFCNYARLDKFDANAPQVPVSERPDIDRWILSDLQLLVRKARQSFESFSVAAFCQEAENFVDDRLSNWYVRRNRRRFWKSEKGKDKTAAYQTLHTVLLTLTKLFAPIVPFLTEEMYRNLVSAENRLGSMGSVHLCDYPAEDRALIDEELSSHMDALLRLKSLGGAARNTAAIKKVRQPFAEMRIQPANDDERRAVERFADQLCEELNIKKVTLHDPAQGNLMVPDVKLNMRVAGSKFGQRLQEVGKALTVADSAAVAAKVQAGEAYVLDTPGGAVELAPSDLLVQPRVPEGWAGVIDRGTQVLIDTRLTPELIREGMAREVVRHVQEARKQAGLEMEDRIELYVHTDDANLRQAIDTHRDYIGRECLVVKWATGPLPDDAYRAAVKVDGKALTIHLRKAAPG